MPADSGYIPLDGSGRGGFCGSFTLLERCLIVLSTILGIIVIALILALAFSKCEDHNITTTVAPSTTTSTTTAKPTTTTTTAKPTTSTTTTKPTTTSTTTAKPSTTTTTKPTTTTAKPTNITTTTAKPTNITTTTAKPTTTTEKPTTTSKKPPKADKEPPTIITMVTGDDPIPTETPDIPTIPKLLPRKSIKQASEKPFVSTSQPPQ